MECKSFWNFGDKPKMKKKSLMCPAALRVKVAKNVGILPY